MTVGGVARNMAEAAHRILVSSSSSSSGPGSGPESLGSGVDATTTSTSTTLLVSPIGRNDEFTPYIVDDIELVGMRQDGLIRTSEHRTAVCGFVLDASGALVGGIADMDIIRNVPENAVRYKLYISGLMLLVVDPDVVLM